MLSCYSHCTPKYALLRGENPSSPDFLCLGETSAQSKQSTWALSHIELFRDLRSSGTRISLLLSEIVSVSYQVHCFRDFGSTWAIPEMGNFMSGIFLSFYVHSEMTLKTLIQTDCHNSFKEMKATSSLSLYKLPLLKSPWNTPKLSLIVESQITYLFRSCHSISWPSPYQSSSLQTEIPFFLPFLSLPPFRNFNPPPC